MRLAVLLLLASIATPSLARAAPHLAGSIAVPGPGTYYDYLSFDPGSQRLYVSLGNRVVVLDPDHRKVLGALEGATKVHGVVVVGQRVFVTDGGSDRVRAYDARSSKGLGEVPTGKNPDAVTFDPASRHVFAFNHSGGSVTVIDPASLAAVATISAPGTLEEGRADGKGSLWVNAEDRSDLVRIDTAKNAVTARWSLAPCTAPTGLAFDEKTRRLFAGCENERLAVIDADSGKVLATVPIGPGVDGVELDPQGRKVYASCGGGQGSLAVISADDYRVLATVATQPRARTLALDPGKHRVFLSAARFEGRTMIADSFSVLIVEP
jgi:DNA-binding beta-propeller fold protein YncE